MITDPAQPFFKDGQWAWDGSQWRRQPLMFGFSGVAGESLSNTNLSAGVNNLDSTPVVAGEIVVVRQVSFAYIGTVPLYIVLYAVSVALGPFLLTEYTPVSAQECRAQCFQILEEGHYLRCHVPNATAGDDLYFKYSGYKMSIAE
jgi:hypothetical protein